MVFAEGVLMIILEPLPVQTTQTITVIYYLAGTTSKSTVYRGLP